MKRARIADVFFDPAATQQTRSFYGATTNKDRLCPYPDPTSLAHGSHLPMRAGPFKLLSSHPWNYPASRSLRCWNKSLGHGLTYASGDVVRTTHLGVFEPARHFYGFPAEAFGADFHFDRSGRLTDRIQLYAQSWPACPEMGGRSRRS